MARVFCFYQIQMNLEGIQTIVFDWGDTLMRDDPSREGPMYLWDTVETLPGVHEVLSFLSPKYILCVATNAGCSDTAAMRKALARAGINDFFPYAFSSADLGVAKPDPAFFFAIAAHLSLNPFQCLMIGNSYEKDIAGAEAAGWNTIWFDEYNLSASSPHKGRVIHFLTELKALL